MKKQLTAFFMIISIVLFGSIPVASIEVEPKLNKSKATLAIGETTTIKVSVTDATLKWFSSDKNIATVSSSGKITAKSKGTTDIIVKFNDKTLTCSVTVKTYRLTAPSSKVTVGNTLQLSLKGNIKDKIIKWSVNDKNIATINSNGLITAKLEGKVKATAKIDGNSYSLNITVEPKPDEKNIYIVYRGNTGTKLHINPDCRTIKNGAIGGTLDECKDVGHIDGWCGVCSKGWTDEKFLKDGNPYVKY